MMKKFALLLLVGLVTACFGNTPNSRFYQLSADASLTPVSTRRFSLRVAEIDVPDYLDRPQIVTFVADSHQLHLAEFERWGEPFSANVSRALADDLSLLLPKAAVRFEAVSLQDTIYTLEAEINRMDAILGDKIQFDVWWTLSKNGTAMRRERTQLSMPVGKSYEDLVAAESILIGRWAEQIAKKLK